jgi:hypothetical protein
MKCTQAEQLASGNWELAKTKTNGKTSPRITRMGADSFGLGFCFLSRREISRWEEDEFRFVFKSALIRVDPR